MKGLVVLCLAGCATLGATPPTAPPRTTHLGLDLERFELMNGLRVVLVHDPTAPEITVTMRYAVGGIDDPAGQAGISHLVEHLMFQQVLGSQTLFAHLEAGASEFNGATTYDATTYVARADPARLDELLSIEAVRAGLRCVSITDSVFEREREVVINELRQRSEASALRAALHGAAFAGGHPYRISLGGTDASVAAITRAQACAFADAHYAPNNAVLVVSGDLTAVELQAALKKFLTHIARREITPHVVVPPPQLSGVLNIDAPIDRDGLIVTWPLPDEPRARIQIRALAAEVAALADRGIRGHIGLVELGDLHAPILGLVAFPAQGESVDAAKNAVSTALAGLAAALEMPGTFGALEFAATQQHAIYRLFASLEPGPERDAWLAAELLAGHDPSATLAAEFGGLRELQRGDAARLVMSYLALDHGQVTVLKASGPVRGRDAVLAVAIHDLGQRRDPPDPALAHAALAQPPPPPIDAIRTRVLPNGLRIVLVPLTSVPTVDARLVFATGTADEPSHRRGVALLAADTLGWDFHYLNDLLTFASAGGAIVAEVGFDHTSFVARGLDMSLDYLLAGLRRVVREGRYDPKTIAAALHREAKRDDDNNAALADAWRGALYGPGHPYVVAGVVRHIAGNLTREDLEQFRAAHYVPANATLVISGHFDVDLAERWIDYLFGDWADRSGRGEVVRPSVEAAPHPVALATYAETAQVGLACAFPANGALAERLVLAEMLSNVAEDVRHQLGASYSLGAHLESHRLASEYVLEGFVESGRAEEAMKLLAGRVAALRDDPDAAARAFVIARARVVTRLRSIGGGASSLAAHVQSDVVLGRAPLSTFETARAAAGLTIDKLAPSLAQLDFARALIALRGPEPAVTAALAALGRVATVLPPTAPAADTDEEPPSTAPVVAGEDDNFDVRDIQPAITEAAPDPSPQLSAAVAAGYSFGSISNLDVSGFSIAGQLGYRIDSITSFGLHLDAGAATTDYTVGFQTPITHHVTVVPLDLAAYIQGDALGFAWGEVFMGLHLDHFDDTSAAAPEMSAASWQTGLVAGLGVGLDVYHRGRVRLSLYGRLQGVLMSDTGFSAFTAGLALRR
ncbi:MAG: insulinase family protein [Deltaproteobacteria bacterium]